MRPKTGARSRQKLYFMHAKWPLMAKFEIGYTLYIFGFEKLRWDEKVLESIQMPNPKAQAFGNFSGNIIKSEKNNSESVKRLQSQQLILQLYYILLCHSNKF